MYLQTRRLIQLLPLVSLLLTGCNLTRTAPQGQPINSPQWQQHRQSLQQITRYQTRGSFVLFMGSRKVYARFHWQQTAPDRFRLLLLNPLGNTELQLDVQGSVTALRDNTGKRYVGDDAEKLIYQLTGMDIPLTSLRQWILGSPGDASNYQLDSTALLQQINDKRGDQHWKVTYLGYDHTTVPPLPAAMVLEEGDQRIKLRIDNWELGQ